MFFRIFSAVSICICVFAAACSGNTTYIGSEQDEDAIIVTDDTGGEQDPVADSDNPAHDGDTTLGESDITDTDSGESPDTDMIISEEIEHFAGYAHIPPVTYTLRNSDRTAHEARIWYSFQPADTEPDNKPIFIFFNGGPGAATGLLFTYNTGAHTADQAFAVDNPVVENPNSWTQLGNIMYIDARQTGFSYSMTDDPASTSQRNDGFSTDNFNVYFDAADFIRVLLDMYARFPALADNPVIMSGESYGGTRQTLMLNMLLYYGKYADGTMDYQDNTLFAAINTHFHQQFPEISEKHIPPRLIAELFPGQIMIQPLVAGKDQMDIGGEMLENDATSAPWEIAAETGSTFSPCSTSWCDPYRNILSFVENNDRDPYCYRRESDWLFSYTDVGIARAVEYDQLATLLSYDPSQISPLYAENRQNAYRYSGSNYLRFPANGEYSLTLPAAEALKLRLYREYRQQYDLFMTGDLDSVFGTLKQWDEYFIDLHDSITQVFYMTNPSPYSSDIGRRFVENLMFVKTFITDAQEDMVIYSPAIPHTIEQFPEVDSITTGNEQFTVTFDTNILPAGAVENAVVTMPHYADSCHSVTVNEPEKIFDDVKTWLEQ